MALCSFVFGMAVAIQTKAICRNIMEIISPGGLPPPLFLPPPNSLQTWIRVFMGFPAIHLTPESMLILTPHEVLFSGLLRQESGAGGKWSFSSFVFLIFVKCISNKSLAKSEPLRKKECGREECFVCSSEGGKCERTEMDIN